MNNPTTAPVFAGVAPRARYAADWAVAAQQLLEMGARAVLLMGDLPAGGTVADLLLQSGLPPRWMCMSGELTGRIRMTQAAPHPAPLQLASRWMTICHLRNSAGPRLRAQGIGSKFQRMHWRGRWPMEPRRCAAAHAAAAAVMQRHWSAAP